MTIFAIAPKRDERILGDNNLMTFRFTQFLENIATILSNRFILEINTQQNSYTLVSSDAGKVIRKIFGEANQRYTIPSNADVAYAVGTFINIQNDGSTNLQLSINDDTLTSSAGLGTGARTIGPSGEATILKVDDTEWKITGDQIT